MLRRKIAAELERWLKSSEQKALFITGSRQIGKSYSIRAFGKANHATYIELNLMENRQAKDALLEARNADDFISRVTLLSGKVDCARQKRSCLSMRSKRPPTS